MDHSEATQLIDGQYEQIFAVRDLASHWQLAWRGVQSTDAEEACSILEELFARHGPPLVLKSDQGSAFIAEVMQELLRGRRVTPLFSPKRRPQYNGAIERANSTHKVYTHQQAVDEDHPRYWTTANLDAARQLSNSISRPWGQQGPSPDDVWQHREPITEHQRDEFARQLEHQRDLACTELGFTDRENLTPMQQDRLERLAISQALETLGYYTKHQVRRPPRKPKRRKLPQLQRALKRQREEANADPATISAPSDTDVDRPIHKTLAAVPSDATIHSASGDVSVNSVRVAPAQNLEPSHREPAKLPWWRKAITPAIKLAKAANISH
jgi:hypothetical protein